MAIRRPLPPVVRFGITLPEPALEDPLRYRDLVREWNEASERARRLGGLVGVGKGKYERRARRARGLR